MASASPPEHTSSGGEANSTSGPDTAAAEAALKARLSRKRTKTGCLTCRKRRIKCGEERPLCKNCVKSKRHCEGYSQRVVFKAPTFDYRPVAHGAGAHITFQAGPVPGAATPFVEPHPPSIDPMAYPGLQPRPPDHHLAGFDPHAQQYAALQLPPHQYPPPAGFVTTPTHAGIPAPQFPHAAGVPPAHGYLPMAPGSQPISPAIASPFVSASGEPAWYATQPLAHTNGVSTHPANLNHPGHVNSDSLISPSQNQHVYLPANGPSPQHPIPGGHPGPARDPHQPSPSSAVSSQTFGLPGTPISTTQQQTWASNSYTPTATQALNLNQQPSPIAAYHPGSMPSASTSPGTQPLTHLTPEYLDQEYHPPTNISTTYMLNTAAVETQDDDYYDVVSDDEMDVEGDTPIANQQPGRERALGRMLAHNQIAVRDLQMRRYDTFLYEGILDVYNVEQVANPLRNPATARVFAHFISATGPSLSIFERHPLNTSVLFSEGSVPLSQRGLWTYTMPMAALRNQGLLHAMLALASLHIARLQGASATPSIQHYAWALKRIHHCVGHPKKRLKLTTIAASMLLGFYEIMTADHMKWNMHLTGSKQLFVEVDFVKLTQKFRRMKAEQAWRDQAGQRRPSNGDDPFTQDDLLDQVYDVDERTVSQLIGREVRYDGHGRVETPQTPIPPDLDLSRFEMLKDLYWWYCKQDAYQSIVSGNPLLMDFNRWADCPPRAPLGRVDAVYGSFDHLILLLGRIADYSARDRKRKLRQVEANGGQWRPAPGMNIPQPPTPSTASRDGFAPGRQFPPPSPAQQMPQFYGMAPPPRANVQMPSSYNPTQPFPTPQSADGSDPFDIDLQAATQAALDEYGRIRAALQTFKMSLGDAFEPLTSEYHAPMETPFGPALFYRAYDIGCLWAVYNMAIIIAIRSHPHMPPAMHAAAGVAAQETAPYANEIGRIAAGIVPGPPDQPLNPSLGSALNESCMPSFFAAVQYLDAQQRHSTVMRIFSIAQRTGWGSAELIANGCETAWVKAAAIGRGPPYTRVVRPRHHSDDPRLNGSWERLDPNADPDEDDDADRRLVKVKAPARLNWAIGVMGVEEDVERMKLN